MVTEDITQSPDIGYQEAPIDALTRKSAQLFAMLVTTYGEGFESFNSYNDTIKENYLWACADLARDIQELSSKVGFARH